MLEIERKDQAGRTTLVTVAVSVLSWLEPCSRGDAVPNPESNPGLVSDCANLLVARHAFSRWQRYLDWSAKTPITEWNGVTVGGSPPRVRALDLTFPGLGLPNSDIIPPPMTGHIPPEFGGLTELRSLDLSWEDLSGEIPPEIGNLPRLERLYLRENEFTGCIPPKLRDVESNDLRGLGLPYCEQ